MNEAEHSGLPLDKSDPGDEVQRRFRYQHAYCAIQCIRLLESNPECVEIICENHEDLLIKRPSGKYVGIQVKTRNLDQLPFKATESTIKKVIARFARLESDFPDQFEGFKLVTNFTFWRDADNQDNLDFVVRQIQQRGGIRGLRRTNQLREYINTICGEYSVKEESVVSAILKLRLEAHESGLEHAGHQLREILTTLPTLENANIATVVHVAAALTFRVYEASSKAIVGSPLALYTAVGDYNSAQDKLILQSKTLTRAIVDELISQRVNDNGLLLHFQKSAPAHVILSGVGVLTEKMIRGGLQNERINKVKDYKASAETAYLRWRHKFGLDEANQRLIHLKSLVDDDCIEAKLAAHKLDLPNSYGEEMYILLRARLKERIASSTVNTAQLFGFTEEHLLGVAGILTEECTVWWSDPFELSSRT